MLQDMYRKCAVNVIIMSLILEICRTHEISDIAGNVEEILCPCLELYMKCEISDITGNMQEMSCFLVMEMYMKCEIYVS